MTSLPDALPLSALRDSLAQYCGKIAYSFESVAGKIIAERLSEADICEPVRPSLVLWACAVNGGNVADALPVGAAFALFERFMLMHDELADASAATITRWGLGQSLNAGDALYAVAFRSLASDVISPARRLQAARLVGEAVLEAIEERSKPVPGPCALTGAALQAGAVIAGADAPTARVFERAGRALDDAVHAGDDARADAFAREAIDALAPSVVPHALAEFSEVALQIARSAA
ncbi:MAG TPA: hypothetical protein VHX17_10800 [Candidatus Cybelea sp.]|jgi:geranylgeranyl pyrophosphate synthase|nr:hypothetical protein [Candidatus Cybelea sp.]